MMSSSFGISRVVSSTRAGIASRPRIGPSTNPRKRSNDVHSPPAATWKNSSAHSRSAAIATTSATSTAPTIGRPRSGTISKSGRGGAAGAAVGASRATSAMGASINRPAPMHDMGDAPHVVPEIDGQRAPHRADEAIGALAARQYGVVARRQLVALGLSLDAIDHRVECGRLLRLHRGVYAVGHRKITGHGVWMAAVLASGDDAVLSHRSAGALWRVREWSGRTTEVTVPRHRRPRPGVVVHEGRLPSDERDEHDGVPVTTPARTLLDL